MKLRTKLIPPLLGALLLSASTGWTEGGAHGHDHGAHSHGDHGHAGHHAAPDPFNMAIKKRSSRPVSFDKYKKYLKEVCAAVEQDGRREQLYELLKANSDKVAECPGCRPLVKAFASACRGSVMKRKPKRKKVKKEEGASEHKDGEADAKAKELEEDNRIRRQREPNVLALNSLSYSFDLMAKDEKRRDVALPAVEHLITIFRQDEGSTRAQVEYLDMMAEHIMAPFSEMADRRDRRARVIEESAKDAHIDPFMKNLTAEEEEDLYDF